jgi:DNA polymerase-3 subunit gamma/tau
MGTVPNTVFERLLEWVGENNSAAVMTEIDTLLNAGNSPSQLARQMVRYLRNALMAKLGGESTELLQVSDDERARVARTAMLFAEEDLTRFLQIMLRSFDEMNYRQEPRFHLELGLLKLVHTQRLIPLEQVLSQLPGGGGNVARPSPAPVRSATAAGPSASPAPLQRSAAPSSAPPQSAPPRSVVSSEAARGGSVASSTPPAQPTFSPFESDTRRKSGPSGSATTAASPAESPRESEPSGATLIAVGTAIALDEALAPDGETTAIHQEPPDPQIRGHASSEAERHVADLEEEIASDGDPEPPAAGEFVSIADKLRDAVSQALHDKGHETASALLRAGQWSIVDGNITVSVAVKKTMLSLTMNAEAERIARTALQQAGSSAKLVVLPGDGSTSPTPPAPHMAKGSLQSQALDNPLVKQAQELFRAEVRDILDLRGRR